MVAKLHKKKITYLLDQDLFDAKGQLPFDHNDATNLQVIFTDDPTPKPAIRLEPIRGPPRWAAKWSGSLFFRVDSSSSPKETFARLDHTEFDTKKFHLVSLFLDKAVEDAIAASGLKEHHLPLKAMSKEALEKVFSDNPNSTIALLGHFEDGKYVTRSADGSKVMISISVEELNALARANNCVILHFGCKAGIESSLGADRKFNPIFAIGRLERAIHASSVGDFLQQFASEKLGLVMDETAFSQPVPCGEFSAYGKEEEGRLESDEFVRDNLIGFVGVILGMSGSDSVNVTRGSSSLHDSGGSSSSESATRGDGFNLPGGGDGVGPRGAQEFSKSSDLGKETKENEDASPWTWIVGGAVVVGLAIFVGWMRRRNP